MRQTLILVLLLFLTLPAVASEPVSPSDWSYQEALRLLQQGTPDSADLILLEANRSLSRNEMAVILARLMDSGRIRDGLALQRLTGEYRAELEKLQARTDVVARSSEEIKDDPQKLVRQTEKAKKRVRFGGEMRLRFGQSGVKGGPSNSRTHLRSRFNMQIDPGAGY